MSHTFDPEIEHYEVTTIAARLRDALQRQGVPLDKMADKFVLTIVAGSFWSFLVKLFDSDTPIVKVSYHSIGLPPCTVDGHAGEFLAGQVLGQWMLIASGRTHMYEDPFRPWIQNRLMRVIGLVSDRVLLTASVGGIKFGSGELGVVDDFIQYGTNPLAGPNISQFGPRFPDVSEAFSPAMQKMLVDAAAAQDIAIRTEVVYGNSPGPSYETPAEVRRAQRDGCGVLGMSLANDGTILAHMKVPMAGIVIVVNQAARRGMRIEHADMKAVMKAAEPTVLPWLQTFVAQLE